MDTRPRELTDAGLEAPVPVVLAGTGCCGLCGAPLSRAGVPPDSGLTAVHLASVRPLCNRCRQRREDFMLRALALGRLVRGRAAAGSSGPGGSGPLLAGPVTVDAGLLLVGGLWLCALGEGFRAFARQEAWAPFAGSSPRQLPAAADHLVQRKLLRPAAAVTPDGRPCPREEEPRAIASGQYALYQVLPAAADGLEEFLSLLLAAGVDVQRVLGARLEELSRLAGRLPGAGSGQERPPSGTADSIEKSPDGECLL